MKKKPSTKKVPKKPEVSYKKGSIQAAPKFIQG